MRYVYLAARRSKDPKTKIGAVLVKDGVIFSEGYNGFARGVSDTEERYNYREFKRKIVCHAEFNCIVNAARLGISTLGSTLYTQGIVCAECCKATIQSGVKELVVHKNWPNLTYSKEWVESIELSKMMLSEAGVKLREFDMVLNETGLLDGKVIKV